MTQKPPQILLVDDEIDILESLQTIIEPLLGKVTKALNGAQALEFLSKEKYAVIVSDLQMPVLSGLDLLTEIRKRGHEAFFIIVTANGNSQAAITALRLGAFDFITKPFNPDSLLLIIKNALKLYHEMEKVHEDFLELSMSGKMSDSALPATMNAAKHILALKRIRQMLHSDKDE